MRQVNYGSQEVSKGRYQPFIEIVLSDGERVQFVASRTFESLEKSKEVAMTAYMILSGKQSNIKYSSEGNLSS